MTSSGQATNRNQRHVASKKDGNSTGTDSHFKPTTELNQETIEYLLQHPDRSGPKGKTLFELADERQRELNGGKLPKWDVDKDNTPEGMNPFDDDPIGPFGNALLYSFSLATLHLTLDVVVYSQYREDIIWSEIFQRAGTVFPIFFVLVYLLHAQICLRFPIVRNLFFLVVSVAAGCYMVYSGNVNGYFYVMKTAPPVGALWIWSVFEMSLPYALSSILAVVGYLLWNGFEFF
ncbi:hypothetical protein GQ43DRAFT_215443 [Delitschia confertaspora ATCC 74209]|uniref:DUF7719 domain-containing protein n=1 Tax=Delitschia confertaspora ATCC 74209 TaxID=1513339 RepID=A0A9P4JG15_9PLEO|nr:hypothetical protein GQ43DRAFT_215443 [Delitschia confertaspora ATCC 74209]